VRYHLLVLALVTSLAVACAPGSPEVDLAAEEAGLRQSTTEWFAAEVRRDMEACLSYVAPDVVIQPEGAPTITGVTEMRALYEEFFEVPFTDLVMEPRTIVVAQSGDLAYDLGGWKMIFEGPDGKTEAPGKSTIIWRKIDGEWKAVVMSFSMDTPPAGAEN
jgi:ketosteroid isomerase-like protein